MLLICLYRKSQGNLLSPQGYNILVDLEYTVCQEFKAEYKTCLSKNEYEHSFG